MEDNKIKGLEDIQLPESMETSDGSLTSDELAEVQREIDLEEKYGDAALQTAAESALSSATFGISDQVAVKAGLTTQEALRERRQRNEASAILGEIGGIVVPTLASGGTSLVAKGASKIGVGVVKAEAARQLTKKAAQKIVSKAIAKSGNKKFAAKVLEKAVPEALGSAVEGSFYGLGELVKEDALGTAEFNAENAIAYAGLGATFGAGVGGAFGAGEALIPLVSKAAGKLKPKIISKTDAQTYALELAGVSPSKISRMKKITPDIVEDLPEFLVEKAKLKKFDSTESMFTNVNNVRESAGKKIGEIIDTVDSLEKQTPGVSISRIEAFGDIASKLEEDFIQKYSKSPGFEAQLAPIKKLAKEIRVKASEEGAVGLKELHALRKDIDKLRKFDKLPGQRTLKDDALRTLRGELKTKIDNQIAKLDATVTDPKVGNLLADFKTANKDYRISSEILPYLEKKIDKEMGKKMFSLTDLLTGTAVGDIAGTLVAPAVALKKLAESDFTRRVKLLSLVEKGNQQVVKKIGDGVKSFLTSAKKLSIPTSTKILMNTRLLRVDEDGNKIPKPKNKQEAFKQMSDAIVRFQNDPELLINKMVKNTGALSQAAPETAQSVRNTTVNAIDFLETKLPKNPSPETSFDLLRRRWQPSSMEIAKFERYAEAVFNPTSVLDDLESGAMTREQVEALRAVYPELYKEIQSQVMETLPKLEKEISYDKRLQLGILLDIPTDQSLIPEHIAGLQASYAQGQQYDQNNTATAVNSTQGGLNKLSFSEDAQTATQRAQNR